MMGIPNANVLPLPELGELSKKKIKKLIEMVNLD